MSQPQSFPTAQATPSGFWEIGVDDLAELADSVRVIDIREANELAMMPALENAEHCAMSLMQPVIDTWAPDEAIVLVCAGGVRSANVAMYMQRKGFNNVVSLRGGMMDVTMRGRR